jgi:predicted dehydrogenase
MNLGIEEPPLPFPLLHKSVEERRTGACILVSGFNAVNFRFRKSIISLILVALAMWLTQTTASAADEVRLITLDPGHFHAGLVQKQMYPQVNPVVNVYAPAGPDLDDHLKRIEGFNTRADTPTRWAEKVHTGPDFLEQMIKDKAGNLVVLAGNNSRKTEYIESAVSAGFNVLADKPMAITPANFELLRKAFDEAAKNEVLLYDIMTERFEITSILQRELARMPDLFGTLEKGTPENPGVVMESVHHFFKEVAGQPLTRPPWFFDVRQQGEAVPDVGTHLVDGVQWVCFPDQALDWTKDIKVTGARRWATTLTAAQFNRATGLKNYPEFLRNDVTADGQLNVYANGEVTYTLRGVNVKVSALWKFEAPLGAGDTLHSLMRGTGANLLIEQGSAQNFKTSLYVENKSSATPAQFERMLRGAVTRLEATWPGLAVAPAGAMWEIVIPDKYRTTHEQHFAQVMDKFLLYFDRGALPAWEVPNMLAKYYTTTEAYRLSHAR